MKLKIDVLLVGTDGISPLPNSPTLKDVCINSLIAPQQEDDEKKKFEKYEIYKKIRDVEEEVELKIEELALIKRVIGKIQPTLIMGQCFELIDACGK